MGAGWSSNGFIISTGFRDCYDPETDAEEEPPQNAFSEDEGECANWSLESFHLSVLHEKEAERLQRRKNSGLEMMNETSVQTEELIEDDLDWDLSDHIDRETQTLPPNATDFQRNRVEAIVQTDYRYFPLAMKMNTTTCNHPREMCDAGTQTEQTKSSVSTQTDDMLVSGKSRGPAETLTNEMLYRNLSATSNISKTEQWDTSSTSSTSGTLESLESQRNSPLITDPLIPKKPFDHQMEASPSNHKPMTVEDLPSPEMSHNPERRDALELWRRLAPFALDELMPSFKMANKAYKRMKRMVDVSIQTESDFLDSIDTSEPFPPTYSKIQLLQKVNLSEIDLHVLTAPTEVSRDPIKLVKYLCDGATNDLYRVRTIFRWVADNIRFDWRYAEKTQTVEEILESQGGVVKDFIKLFSELSFIAGLKVKILHGFARSYEHRVGKTFEPGKDPLHSWVAIFLSDSWRFIDPTWGSGYLDEQGRYHPDLEEHYFLTDPKDFIFTHIPWNEETENYERWQLLDEPMPLGEFNLLPKVTPQFFACGLRLRKPKFSPVVFNQQTEIQVASSLLLRYKFNLFVLDETEEKTYNEWVFCQLKEGGVVGSFTVVAPFAASFQLKVYSKSDEKQEQQSEESFVPHSFTFLLECTKARKYPVPWPLHEAAWGATPRLYECGLYPVNQSGPIICTWGGRKILYLEKVSDVLLMFQVFDSNGTLLEPKGIIKKEESEDQISISIVPPGIGFFKFLIYGIQKPQVKGMWHLPLLASYLVECKMSMLNPSDKKDPSSSAEVKPKQKKRVIVARR